MYGTVQSSGPRVSEEDERRHFEDQEKVKRDSLVSAVEDKIRRQLAQTLETSQVVEMGRRGMGVHQLRLLGVHQLRLLGDGTSVGGGGGGGT